MSYCHALGDRLAGPSRGGSAAARPRSSTRCRARRGGSFPGSSLKTPSTRVALSRMSASSSKARWAAAVSVVTKGLPVPAARMMIRPFFQVPAGAAADVGLGHAVHADGGHQPVSQPSDSRASCRARPFITVASMPM